MLVVAAYPKSGMHLTRQLLRGLAPGVTYTHGGPRSNDMRARAPHLHVVRDVRDVVVSAVCHFVLQRPELDPEQIRPHVMDMADRLRGPWEHVPGADSWSDYVLAMTERSERTVTFRHLVEDPSGALRGWAGWLRAPLMVLKSPTWEHQRFRRGVPGGWVDVLTPAQERQIREWHAPGMLLVEAANAAGVSS